MNLLKGTIEPVLKRAKVALEETQQEVQEVQERHTLLVKRELERQEAVLALTALEGHMGVMDVKEWFGELVAIDTKMKAKEEEPSPPSAPPLYADKYMPLALEYRSPVELKWQGLLGEPIPVHLDSFVCETIRGVKKEIKWQYAMTHKYPIEGWHLQVYMDTDSARTSILLTSPNRAYFWRHYRLAENLKHFYSDPELYMKTSEKELLAKLNRRKSKVD